MKLDELVTGLVRCGLAEKEARAFVHLTDLGKSKVTDIAKRAGLKRAETYQILERLQGRGLVEGTLERPRLFTAVGPDRALAILLEERAAELKSVERERGDLVAGLSKIGGAAPESTGVFRILHDQNQIRGQLLRSLAAAKREIVVVTSGRGLSRLVLDGFDEALKTARSRGADVRILTEVQPGQEDAITRLGAFADVRHLMVPRPLRFVIVDDAEILQYVTADNPTGQAAPGTGQKETAFWIGMSDHVQAQRAFFDDLWNDAVTAAARFDEIKSGRAAEHVSVVKGRFTRYEKQKEMALRATHSLVAVLSEGDAQRIDKSGLKRLYASLAKNGVAVRILVTGDVKVDVPGATVKSTKVRAPPFQVVDGREALLAFTRRDATESVTETGEFGVHVALESGAAAYQHLFEDWWRASG